MKTSDMTTEVVLIYGSPFEVSENLQCKGRGGGWGGVGVKKVIV